MEFDPTQDPALEATGLLSDEIEKFPHDGDGKRPESPFEEQQEEEDIIKESKYSWSWRPAFSFGCFPSK